MKKVCLALGITPNYVNLHTNIKSPAARHATRIARTVWVKSELQAWYKKRDSIAHYRFLLQTELTRELHWIEWNLLDDYVRQRSSEIAQKKRSVLLDKINRLRKNEGVITQNQPRERPPHKFHDRVVNLSNVAIEPQNLEILEKGLKYVPNLPFGNRELDNLLIDCDVALHNNGIGLKTVLAKKIPNLLKNRGSIKTKSNELTSIKSLKKFTKDNNLIIEKADKGNAVVVMSKEDYIEKCNNFISSNQIVKLRSDPTIKFQKVVLKAIKSSPNIFKHNEIYKVTVMNPKAPRFFGLPKIHKTDTPIRPVVSSVTAPSRKLAAYLNSLFRDCTEFQPKYGVKNSSDLCEKLSNKTPPPPHHTLVSFDVSNLFTSIPVSRAVDVAEEVLKNKGADLQFIKEFVKLLKLPNISHLLSGNDKISESRAMAFQTPEPGESVHSNRPSSPR
ncbi:uncharacterized protein [Hetaerina americana]|uniref:uncharacterized protein n=1 Tax=Hetaerina americana TaxID=62018 RepID=UPI003A7F3AC1